MSDALREAREYRDPTCPICEGEGCQCPQGDETINEGFKSAAQRRAAFASGYKAKGKKKKEETEAEELEEKFTSAQIKQAYGILNDPRYKQGNYSGAVNVINKIAPGLADHPDVKNALKRANEELEEGMVKRVMQTVHDKLAKEGGAAGFDDLAKEVKKEFGITISKDTLKNMPGVKQHRDGDYILEDLEEAVGMTGGSRTLDYFVKYRMGPGDRFITNGPFTLRDAVKFKREVERKGGQAQVTQDPFEERELGEAKYRVDGQLSYKGISGYDGFEVVVNANSERDAEDKAYDALDKARERRKIGPGGGGSLDDVEFEGIELTSDRISEPSTFRVAEFDPSKDLKEFTQAQLARLKKEYDPLKGQRLSMDQINKMQNMLNKYSTDQLVKLANTDIPFLATSAKSIAVMKRGKKWSDFKQGLDMGEALELQCEACWSGYKQVGLKKKGNRMVPNCVPEEVYVELFGEADLSKSQVKMVHKTADKLPKDDFKDRYGKDGDSVRYATATNMVKKKLGISEFTKRDFKNLEKVNDHDGAAKAVVDMHGTGAEKMKIDAIIARNNMRGHITKADQTKRDDIVRKYYNKLKEMNTGRNDIRGSFTNAQLSRMKQTWAKKSISDLTKSVKDYVMKLDKPTQAAIIAAKINHLSDYVDKNFDESKVIGEETMAEMSYKDKFAKALKDSGKTLADMSDDEKKKFFNKVDSMHSAKNEEVEIQEMQMEMKYEMMKKEMMKKMEMMKAETDPEKLEMMKKEMMKEMDKMPEMMKKEMMKKMNAAYNMNMEEAEPMTRDTMSLKDKEINAMKMNAMKMPIRAMYKNMDDPAKKDEMKKMNAMKKMEELTPAQKKLPMGLQKAIMKKDKKEDMPDKKEMKKMNAMKKMKEGKYHDTKPGSLEEAVMSALSYKA